MITLMLLWCYWKHGQFRWLFHDTFNWHVPTKLRYEDGCLCATCKVCKQKVYNVPDRLGRSDWQTKESIYECHKI